MWLILFSFLWLVHGTKAPDPVFGPAQLQDVHGNIGYANSSISWASMPPGLPYAPTTEYNDGGLGPFFAFARNFINTVMSKEPPYDLILGIAAGTVDIMQEKMKIISYAVGFAVCVVIGVLFIILFPLIGCCFCCCRCCGFCGGKMQRQRKDTDNTWRIIFSIILCISTLFLFVGVLCAYVTNNQVSTSITSFEEILVNNLDNVQTFLNNTVSEITYLTTDTFNFTAEVISRDLDNIGALVGIPVRNKMAIDGGVTVAINSIIALDLNVAVAGALLLKINNSATQIKTDGQKLKTDLAAVKADVDTAQSACSLPACSAIDASKISMDVDFSTIPDISSEVSTMENVLGRDLTALAMAGRAEFDDIPARVTNETKGTVTQIKDLLTKFSDTIDKQISSITDLPSGVGKPLKDIKDQVKKVSNQVSPYDTYRWYGGMALPCLGLLVAVLQVIGLFLGACGYDDNREAHERSGLSHTGGQCLMAAAGFIFIFGALLMLLCVVFFLVGGLLEKIVCQPLSDPKYTIFNKVLDGPNGVMGNYPLGEMLLQNGTINLTIASVLEGCKNNGGAFKVLRLDSFVDLDQVTSYKKSIDIQSQIDAINVDLSTVELLSPSTESQLKDFSNAIGIDFTTFISTLSASTAKMDLTALHTDLVNLGTNAPDPTSKTAFSAAAAKLAIINGPTGSFATVKASKDQLKTDVEKMKQDVANVPTMVNKVIADAKVVEAYIQQNGSAVIKQMALSYGNRVLGIADEFTAYVLKKVNNDVAACKPLYDIYESILVVGLCKYIVDVLNGFWFSLGWIIFFETISVVCNIKLAKFLRRMKEPDGMEDPSRETTFASESCHKESHPESLSKIAPADDVTDKPMLVEMCQPVPSFIREDSQLPGATDDTEFKVGNFNPESGIPKSANYADPTVPAHWYTGDGTEMTDRSTVSPQEALWKMETETTLISRIEKDEALTLYN